MATRFETPQEAEDAFYAAFENASAQAMQAAWDDNPDIVCIHPGSPALRGWEAIAKSWKHIFAAPQRISITVRHREWIEGADLAIHVLEEQITAGGRHAATSSMIPVTNAYRFGKGGWRMILHHASPPPIDPGERASMAKSRPRRAVH